MMDDTRVFCSNETDYSEQHVNLVITTAFLSLIDLLVVCGNSLVIAAVITTRKLRSVTNVFIVSLACADLFLGLSVLPFSIAIEVLDAWVFGSVWCSIWLAVDVWLCTASILNLCVISFDRYLAINKPIQYPRLMSPTRGKVLVSLVWIVSFVICLPPLLGWNDDTTNIFNSDSIGTSGGISSEDLDLEYLELFTIHFDNDSSFINDSSWGPSTTPCANTQATCELTPTKSYRIYAALGSFYLPMLVMFFFYCSIYRTAVKTAACLRKGELNTKQVRSNPVRSGSMIGLRVHRGGFQASGHTSENFSRQADSGKLSNSDQSLPESIDSGSTSYTSSIRIKHCPSILRRSTKSHKRYSKRFKTQQSGSFGTSHQRQTSVKCATTDLSSNGINYSENKEGSSQRDNASKRVLITDNCTSPRRFKFLRNGNANVNQKQKKIQIKRFNRETKAAKTLAIIVGAFFVCWFPFFTIYLTGAFCDSCVSPLVFSVCFWLGYCNSVLNPCIYALFSRDFRNAFKRLLMCKTQKQKSTENIYLHQQVHHVQEPESASDC